MAEQTLTPFESPAEHAAIAEIIRRRSRNQADVRAVALAGLDLSFATSILELGCGFGFMTDVLAPRVATGAHIIGVDACAANRAPFLSAVTRAGRRGSFICQRIREALDWADATFDLVVASYSLYYFPGVLPEIARALSPTGLLVALTHREEGFGALLRTAGLVEPEWHCPALVQAFSAESGAQVLPEWFGRVARIDYDNALIFEAEHADELQRYLRFRLPLMLPDVTPTPALETGLMKTVRATLALAGRVVLEKSDAAFHCWEPRCR
jgi:SAM-dependent methyltransferase